MAKGSSSKSTDSSSTGSSHASSFLHSLASSHHSNHPKTFNIAVVGLSGTEKERGAVGSGKSCLCNRFVRPFADDYYPEHISVLSQSDFSGHIVNSDHWLYWGEVSKITEEGTELHFSIIEQTEFIDDSTLQTFKSSKFEQYYKRCSVLKLSSSQKLMYICKNQLGIEKEYEQRYLPDGKFNVDGFVCIFDVSHVSGRTLEQNIEQTSLILNSLVKTKKPVVLATTKNDEANEIYIREVDRLINRKEYRGSIPLIETSSHENVNVDLAFVVCAQIADKGKGRAKIIPYFEAIKYRKDALEYASEAFQALLNISITDYRILWHTVCKSLSLNAEFLAYVDLFGQEAAHVMFKRHVKKLKDDFIRRKSQMYLRLLPELLNELLPNLDEQLTRQQSTNGKCNRLNRNKPSNEGGDDDDDQANGTNVDPDEDDDDDDNGQSNLPPIDWESVKLQLKNHPDFDQYFVETPPHIPWYEIDLIASGETRIPWNVIDSNEGEIAFTQHTNALQDEDRRRILRLQLKQHLTESAGFISPGKTLNEVRLLLFSNEQLVNSLTENDIQEVYDEYQREIIDIAKKHFQELLLEHAELFYHFASFGPGSVITQDDIYKISEILSHDVRYTALNRLEQDRMLMLLRHLAFVHGPIRENCPNYPDCIDRLIECIFPSLIAMANGNNLSIFLSDSNVATATTGGVNCSIGRGGHNVSGSSTSSNRSPKNASHSSSINNNVSNSTISNQLNNNSNSNNNNHQNIIHHQSSISSSIASTTAYESMSSLNLIILASNNLGYELATLLKVVNEKVIVNGIHYSLDVKIINSDDINEKYSEITSSGFNPHGCICIYSNIESLEYVTDAVEKVLLSNLELDASECNRGALGSSGEFIGQISSMLLTLPLTILFASEIGVNDSTYSLLLDEGKARARSLQCPFFNVTSSGKMKNTCDGSTSTTSSNSTRNGTHESSGSVNYCSDGVMQALVSLIDSVQAKSVSGLNVLSGPSGAGSNGAMNSSTATAAATATPMATVAATTSMTNDVNCANSSSSLNISLPLSAAGKSVNPDLRILVLAMCGDPYKLEDILTPYLTDKSTVRTSINSFAVEVFIPPSSSSNNPLPLDDSGNSVASASQATGQSPGAMRSHLSSSPSPSTCKKVIEFIWTSYHNAQVFRDELLHGFILIYSGHRRASLSTLAAFSRNIPNTPTQMIAVADGEPLSWLYSQNNQMDELIADGEILAGKIHAHFISISTDVLKLSYLTEFFNDALERKPQIEAAFDLDDSDDATSAVVGMDDGSINRRQHQTSSNISYPTPQPRLPRNSLGKGGKECNPPPVPSRFESYEVTQSIMRQDGDGDYEELPSERSYRNNGASARTVGLGDDDGDEDNIQYGYGSEDESDQGDIEDEDLDDYNRIKSSIQGKVGKKKKSLNRNKLPTTTGGGGTSSDDILDDTDDRMVKSKGHRHGQVHLRGNRFTQGPLNVTTHSHEQQSHHQQQQTQQQQLMVQRHSRNLDIDPYSTVPDDDDTDDGNCRLNRLGEGPSSLGDHHLHQQQSSKTSPNAMASSLSGDHLIKPSQLKNRRSLHAGVQPPPYSVAISSTSSFTSSASPPPGYPIGYSSSSSRPLQVPLDVVQASLLQANEFDQLHHMSNNRQHRRTSVPVSLGSSHLLLDLNDGTSDAIKSSNRRLNRPDVLGLRSVERQLSLPVETGSGRRLNTRGKGGHHHQHHLTHRRNNDDEDDVDVDVVVGDDDDDVNDEDENLQGHRVDSAGGLLDDDDGDNECGDDELSEYGAYPPPEPAPPDFIPSSDHSAFLSSPNIIHHQIGHNSALAVGGHTSTSSIEGWPDSSSFLDSSVSKKPHMFSNYLATGDASVGSFAGSNAFSAIRSKYQEGGSRSSIRSNVSVDTNTGETSSNNSTGTAIGSSNASVNNKPIGRLNLSQFDNITNAVGKLTFNQQPTTSASRHESSEQYFSKGRIRSLARRKESSPMDKASDSESDWSSPDTGHGSGRNVASTSHKTHLPSSTFVSRSSRSGSTRDSSITSGISAGTNASNSGIDACNTSSTSTSGINDGLLLLASSSNKSSNMRLNSLTSNSTGPTGSLIAASGTVSNSLLTSSSSSSSSKRAGIPVAPPKLPPFDPSLIASVTSATNNGITSSLTATGGSINSQATVTSPYSKLLNVFPDSAIDDLDGKEAAARQLGLMLQKSSNLMTSSASTDSNVASFLANRSSYIQGGFRSSLGASVAAAAAASSSSMTSSSSIKKKLREEEKKRLKEEEKLAKRANKLSKKKSKNSPQLNDFVQSGNNLIPLFVEKCINFIESDGLDSEGIYRVPGNRAHVDLLFQKFDEDSNVSIKQLDIPVNAVATALKDFFSKRLPSIIPSTSMEELTEIANIRDRSNRLLALRELLRKLPPINFAILKFVFAHFVRVSENSKLNSMDSKNLAICWWPTLLPLEFNDMLMFERMRPHLEESVQTMIDQFALLFDDEAHEMVV